MASTGPVWPIVGGGQLIGQLWPIKCAESRAWPFLFEYVWVSRSMTQYGRMWRNMAEHDRVCSYIMLCSDIAEYDRICAYMVDYVQVSLSRARYSPKYGRPPIGMIRCLSMIGYGHIWPVMAECDGMWHSMAKHEPVSTMIAYGRIRPSMDSYGPVWLIMAYYVPVWSAMSKYIRLWHGIARYTRLYPSISNMAEYVRA